MAAVLREPCPAGAQSVLSGIGAVEVSIVSDAVIAEVHEKFLRIPGPTDVITFDHGEIVVSADTAEARAREFGHSPDREIGLYVIHGLLHLHGYDDMAEDDRRAMHSAQEAILRDVWPEEEAPL